MNLSNLRNFIVEADDMGPIIPTIKRLVIPAGYPGGPEGPADEDDHIWNPIFVDYGHQWGPEWADPDGPFGPSPPIRVNPDPEYDFDGDGVVGSPGDKKYKPQNPWHWNLDYEDEYEYPYDPGDIHYPGPNHGIPLPDDDNPWWWPFS